MWTHLQTDLISFPQYNRQRFKTYWLTDWQKWMTSCESRLGFTGWSKAFLKQPWTTAKIVSSRQAVLVSAFRQICSSKWMFCCVWVKWPSPNLPYIWTKTTASNSVSFEQWVYLTWDKIAFQGTRRLLFCHLVFFMFSSLEENMWLLAAVACRPLVFTSVSGFPFCKCWRLYEDIFKTCFLWNITLKFQGNIWSLLLCATWSLSSSLQTEIWMCFYPYTKYL